MTNADKAKLALETLGEQTIDITPTWKEATTMLIAIITNGSPKGRADAIAELYRMAELADRYAALPRRLGS